MTRMIAVILAAWLFVCPAQVHAQSAPIKVLSTVSTNCQTLRASRTLFFDLLPINTTTTLYYLKLYDKATTPNPLVDIPKWTIPVPYGASNSGGGVSHPSANGLQFPTGFSICLVGGIADNDNTNAAAGIALNFGITGY